MLPLWQRSRVFVPPSLGHWLRVALGTCGFLATSDTKLTLVAQGQVYKSLRCLLLGEKAPQGQIGVHAHTSQSEGTGAEQQYCLLQSLWETR